MTTTKQFPRKAIAAKHFMAINHVIGGSYLCSLKHRFGFQIFIMARILQVGLDPADVFTASEAPFLQTLNTRQLKDSMSNLCVFGF